MCFGTPDSTATVKSNTTPQQDTAQRAKNLGIPPAAMDATDTLLEDARKRMALQLNARSSRRDAMKNDAPLGDLPLTYSLLGK